MASQFVFDKHHVVKIPIEALLALQQEGIGNWTALKELHDESLIPKTSKRKGALRASMSEEELHEWMKIFLEDNLGAHRSIRSKLKVGDGGIIDMLIECNGIPCCLIEYKKNIESGDHRHQTYRYLVNLMRENPLFQTMTIVLIDGFKFSIMVATFEELNSYYPRVFESIDSRKIWSIVDFGYHLI